MAARPFHAILASVALLRGFGAASVVFIASFAVHIVGGASGQGWLFGLAIASIFLSSTGFPLIVAAGAELSLVPARPSHVVLATSGLAGAALTASALWAANGRALTWWEAPAGLALVAVVSGAGFWAADVLRSRGTTRGASFGAGSRHRAAGPH
jgi:hypothetical protein